MENVCNTEISIMFQNGQSEPRSQFHPKAKESLTRREICWLCCSCGTVRPIGDKFGPSEDQCAQKGHHKYFQFWACHLPPLSSTLAWYRTCKSMEFKMHEKRMQQLSNEHGRGSECWSWHTFAVANLSCQICHLRRKSGQVFGRVWNITQSEDFPHKNSERPDIALEGKRFLNDRFGGHPFQRQRNLQPLCYFYITISLFRNHLIVAQYIVRYDPCSRQTKIADLHDPVVGHEDISGC